MLSALCVSSRLCYTTRWALHLFAGSTNLSVNTFTLYNLSHSSTIYIPMWETKAISRRARTHPFHINQRKWHRNLDQTAPRTISLASFTNVSPKICNLDVSFADLSVELFRMQKPIYGFTHSFRHSWTRLFISLGSSHEAQYTIYDIYSKITKYVSDVFLDRVIASHQTDSIKCDVLCHGLLLKPGSTMLRRPRKTINYIYCTQTCPFYTIYIRDLDNITTANVHAK